MKIIKEQTEILLMEYAAGTLDEACSLLVASYITLCPEARRYVGDCEAMGGALIEGDCPPVAMERGSLQAVLGRLDEPPQCPPKPCATISFCQKTSLPAPLAGHLNARHSAARWHILSPGVRYCSIPVQDSTHEAVLMRLAPGARTPRHRHGGVEMTLVLQGGYHDEYGAYDAGDLVIADETTEHQPVATEEGCMCVSVTSAPVRFSSRTLNLLQLLFR